MFVMEYADSGSLRNYLKKNFSKLTWDDKYFMAYQLSSAVSCLHNKGIVHGDLVIYFIIIQSFNSVIFRYSFSIYAHFFLIALWQYISPSKYDQIGRFRIVEKDRYTIQFAIQII
jgi:serine/threonine protein kinase